MVRITLSILLLLISACSTSATHPKYGDDPSAYPKDYKECKKRFYKTREISGMHYYRSRKTYHIRKCMRELGWEY